MTRRRRRRAAAALTLFRLLVSAPPRLQQQGLEARGDARRQGVDLGGGGGGGGGGGSQGRSRVRRGKGLGASAAGAAVVAADEAAGEEGSGGEKGASSNLPPSSPLFSSCERASGESCRRGEQQEEGEKAREGGVLSSHDFFVLSFSSVCGRRRGFEREKKGKVFSFLHFLVLLALPLIPLPKSEFSLRGALSLSSLFSLHALKNTVSSPPRRRRALVQSLKSRHGSTFSI